MERHKHTLSFKDTLQSVLNEIFQVAIPSQELLLERSYQHGLHLQNGKEAVVPAFMLVGWDHFP